MENSNEEKDLTEVWCDTEFDVPHDQQARNKQLEESQQQTKMKRAVERGLSVWNAPSNLGPSAKKLIVLMTQVNERNSGCK